MNSKSKLRREAIQDPLASANRIAAGEAAMQVIFDHALATLDFTRQGKMLFWKSEMEKVEQLQLVIIKEVQRWMDTSQ